MKEMEKRNIAAAVKGYVDSAPEKPLLIWFHSNPDIDEVKDALEGMEECFMMQGHPLAGHTQFIDKDGNVKKIADHPELFDEFFYPSKVTASTRFFVYHRYFEQLSQVHIQYIKDLMRESKMPVVCLVNDYSMDENPLFDASAFEEWECE